MMGVTPEITNLRKSIIERTPLMRKSQIFHNSFTNSEKEDKNDDDAERSLLIASDRSRSAVGTPVSSTPLGTRNRDTMASSPLKEHFQGCLKLYAENKINKDNAWNLQLIDFMTAMLRKHDARMDNLQMASTVVDASTRIYSFRVDAVHHDVLKMAGGLSKASQAKRGKKDDDQVQDGEAGPSDEIAPTQTRKKKKQGRGSIATNLDTLNAEIDSKDCIDPFFERLAATAGDITSSNRAFNATLPVEDETLALLLRTDKPYLKSINQEDTDALDLESMERIRMTKSLVPFYNGDICEPFTGFSISDWNPDDEDAATKVNGWMDENRLNLSQQDMAFDMNADVEPIPQDDEINDILDDEPLAGIDSEEEGDVAVAACVARVPTTQVARLTDMKPTSTADMRLEYSYSSAVVGAWAGPSHWKLKNNVNRFLRTSDRTQSTIGGRQTIDNQKKAGPTKPKKQLDFVVEGIKFDCSRDAANDYTVPVPAKITISRKTLSLGQTWNEKNFKTPVDRGLDAMHFRKLYLKKSIVMALKTEARKSQTAEGDAASDALHVSDVRDYDYENENDTSYCPATQPEHDGDDAWIGEEGAQVPTVHDASREQESDGLGGMVEPPAKVAKIFIPYAMRAKKVDMKQLKQCAWKMLTEKPKEMESGEVRINQMLFSKLYSQLPSRLSPNMKESLSVSLALLAVLHLANEKGLVLKKHDDHKDFTIVGLL